MCVCVCVCVWVGAYSVAAGFCPMRILNSDRGGVGLDSLPWILTHKSLVIHAG